MSHSAKPFCILHSAFCIAFAAFAAKAAVTWYAVDPMSERQFLPDAPPVGGLEGEPVRIVAAQGEYEPGSFVVTADADLGKVDFAVGSLKGEGGATIPATSIDLKTVKVWYQAGTAWFSYFQDTGLKLCPELLLHDEDLVKVDEEKVANYARLDDGDGKFHYHWLTTPRGIDPKGDDAFHSMKENFKDAPSFAGATVEKGRYKQFFLTVHVPDDARPGLYTGEVRLRRREGKVDLGAIPVRLRVLPFALPGPCTFFDWNKEFRTWFCTYISLDSIQAVNGNDKALARRQLAAVMENFARHNLRIPAYRGVLDNPEAALAAGMDLQHAVLGGMKLSWSKAAMRHHARLTRARIERVTGKPLDGSSARFPTGASTSTSAHSAPLTTSKPGPTAKSATRTSTRPA